LKLHFFILHNISIMEVTQDHIIILLAILLIYYLFKRCYGSKEGACSPNKIRWHTKNSIKNKFPGLEINLKNPIVAGLVKHYEHEKHAGDQDKLYEHCNAMYIKGDKDCENYRKFCKGKTNYLQVTHPETKVTTTVSGNGDIRRNGTHIATLTGSTLTPTSPSTANMLGDYGFKSLDGINTINLGDMVTDFGTIGAGLQLYSSW